MRQSWDNCSNQTIDSPFPPPLYVPCYRRGCEMQLTEVDDADGHVIEPGDLWLERLPKDLRELGPHYYLDEAGIFRSKLYGLELNDLTTLWGVRAVDLLNNMGLSAAMGVPVERVFSDDPREKYPIVHAPDWAVRSQGCRRGLEIRSIASRRRS